MLLLIFLAMITLSAEETNKIEKDDTFITVVAGYHAYGDLNFDGTGHAYDQTANIEQRHTLDTGFSGSIAIGKIINDTWDLGIGTSFQSRPEIKNEKSSLDFIPVYALVRIKGKNKPVTPFITGFAGYSFLSNGDVDDTNGGLFAGGGFGFMVDKSIVELVFKHHSGKSSLSVGEDVGASADFGLNQVVLNVGVNIPFFQR